MPTLMAAADVFISRAGSSSCNEIAAAGIMRGFIINPCNMYFTIDRKIHRFIKTTLKIYEVPKNVIDEMINTIDTFNMKEYAIETINTLYEYISTRT